MRSLLDANSFLVATLVTCACIPVGPVVIADDDRAPSSQSRDYALELPRFPPLEPADALGSFEIVPGYALELAAAEPLVRDPVAIAFDADERMYVVEMCDYSEQADEQLGNVRMLSDVDGDGKYDVSTFFVTGLSWPTAVICYDGGIFVGAAPDIWFLKDVDGDGVAEVRRKVFTGFGRSNVQGLLNSFCWGPDNRIYGQTSSAGGTIVRADGTETPPLSLNGRDFSFDPRTLELRAETGGAQHGMCFDDWGNRFASHNSDHLQQFVYSDQYASRFAGDLLPPSRQSIAVDGPQAEVFRISPVEPWRVLRTHLRLSKTVPGLVEGGGRAAGYFTGATGVTIYRGDAMPELKGQAFIGDVGSNIVHRKQLIDSGIHFRGQRIDAGREFVASKDTWFRPAQFANAPDGTLYICDVYREVIEHPASLPPEIKQHLDLTSGRDRGRIYRVVPSSFVRRPSKPLSSASTQGLVAMLGHPNGWHRDTASRLLYERMDRSAIPPLYAIARSEWPETRIHALNALLGTGEQISSLLLRNLNDPHPYVAERSALLAGQGASSKHPHIPLGKEREFRSQAVSLLSHASARQQFAFALALNEDPVADDGIRGFLVETLLRCQDDRWLTGAAIRAFHLDDVVPALLQLASREGTAWVCHNLAAARGGQLQPSHIDAINRWLATAPASITTEAVVRGLYLALVRTELYPQIVAPEQKYAHVNRAFQRLVRSSRERCSEGDRTLEQRLEDIAVLSHDVTPETLRALAPLLDPSQPQPVQLRLIEALRRWDDIGIVEGWLAAWPRALPSVRSAMGRAIVSKPMWSERLLDEIEQNKFPISELESTTIELLVTSTLAQVRQRAQKLVAAYRAKQSSREQVLEEYRGHVFALNGDREVGRALFQRWCAACHRVEEVGTELGPNLASFKYRGVEAILLNVLDPNREVNPQYINYVARTIDDRIVTGMIQNETATSVTLVRGEKLSDTLLLSEIESLKSSQKSIMPEGFEQQLDHQAMADLLSYLTNLP